MKDFFSHLHVIELSSVLAGPAVGMFFAELGAKVIKIENKSTNGDVTRQWKLPSEEKQTNISSYFSSVNYGKKHVFLDLSNPQDKDVVLEALLKADIVIVNFKKGDDLKFNLSYTEVQKINPDIIYGHITGYEPEDDKTAFDVVLQAETGFLSMTGTPTSGPVKMPVALIDILAAHQLKEAILLALLKKQVTGKGSYCHVSLYKSAIASLANQASGYLMNNHVAQPIGTLHPNIAPYGEILTTLDQRQLVLAIGNHVQFKHLCEILDLKELPDQEKFNSNTNRVENRLELIQLLQQKASQINADQLEEQLNKYKVPHGFIHRMDEVFKNRVAQSMILPENIDGIETKRVSTIAFNQQFLHD